MAAKSILIVGGCGFAGFHITRSFFQDLEWTPRVHAMCRNPTATQNRIAGVRYHRGSITSESDIRRVLKESRPTIIINTVTPPPIGGNGSEDVFFQTNVVGTRSLLETATSDQRIQGLIHLSSVAVMQDYSFTLLDESAPLKTAASWTDPYSKSKAMSDTIVLNYNGTSGLKTLCLRLPLIYGERDSYTIPSCLQMLRTGRQNIQIGNGKSLMDTLSADNMAAAIILAANKLSTNSSGVDGQAFFITDGRPMSFWTFKRRVLAFAADNTADNQLLIIPTWMALNVAWLMDCISWIFAYMRVSPRTFHRQILEYSTVQRTVSIDKARQRLGYTPVDNMDANMREGVEWARAHGS